MFEILSKSWKTRETTCIKIIESDSSSARTKHIAVRHHYLRDLFEQGIITVKYCPSQEMLADILTKPLGKMTFQSFVVNL